MKNIHKFGGTEVKVNVSCNCSNVAKHDDITVKPGKNLIRILESFVVIPAIALSMPFMGGGVVSVNTQNSSPIVAIADVQPRLSLAGITKSFGLNKLAFDEATDEVDQKAEMLKAQAAAIDFYFEAHNMPLKGSGTKMAEVADKYGLDWRLIPAISVRESTGGRFACRSVTHSYFGWGSCRINFKSKDEAIESIARNLSGNNPNTDHHYPKGSSIKDILKKYNSVIPAYTAQVLKIMDTIGVKDLGKPVVEVDVEAAV